MIRRKTITVTTVAMAALLCQAMAQRAQALTIITPTEGQIVRETVKIAIPRSAVPSGGFMGVTIDGRFQGSASVPMDPKANVVYYWNTKAPITDPRNETKWISDGRHEIEVAVYDAQSTIIESAKVTVRVANKVPMTTPSPPIRLYYKYRTGDLTKYSVRVRGDLLDSTGNDLMGGQSAFSSDYVLGQWVEDVRPNGDALVRYRLMDQPRVTLLGQPVVGSQGQEQQLPPSLYKLVDRFGRTIQTDVVHRGPATAVSDIMVPLPGKPLALGDTWQSSWNLKIEGLTDIIRFASVYQLESLEYEMGRECAKIVGNLTGSNIRLNLLSGQLQTEQGAVLSGKSEVYLAYKAGKIIRAKANFEVNAMADASAIGNLANAGGSAPAGPIIGQSDEETGPEDSASPGAGAVAPPASYNPYGPSTYNPYGAPAPTTGQQTGARTSVKLRITVVMELK